MSCVIAPSGTVQELKLVAGIDSGDRPSMNIQWKPPVVDLRNNVIRAYKVHFTRTDAIDFGRVVFPHSGGPILNKIEVKLTWMHTSITTSLFLFALTLMLWTVGHHPAKSNGQCKFVSYSCDTCWPDC